MFGPNTVFSDSVNISFTHRDEKFFDLYSMVTEEFQRLFALQDYDVLFIPGSASVGMDAILYSLKGPVNVVGVDGTFKTRWQSVSNSYKKYSKDAPVDLYCLFETSCSTYFKSEDKPCIVDAISAFPYYTIPKNAIAFVTCLNKQLGSYVGCSVVCIRKDSWNYFKQEQQDQSYLNLWRYKTYAIQKQLPMTAPTFIFEHFLKVLRTFNINALTNNIKQRSEKLCGIITKDNIIGDAVGPAITIRNNVLDEDLCKKFKLYGYEANRPHIQIFTYSEDEASYELFFEELSRYDYSN